ncbi:MAG: hypothetical protein ACLQF1_15560 [Methyloceanibacter sp.]
MVATNTLALASLAMTSCATARANGPPHARTRFKAILDLQARDEGHLQSIAASAIAAKSKNADRQLGCDDEAAYSQARKDYSEFEADEADVLASL